MNRTRWISLLAVLLVGLPGCGVHEHSHDQVATDDQGDERPTVAVTRWTDRTELFMEYPVFVAGKVGRSAIHVTDLADFSPLNEGLAIVGLRSADGRLLEFRGGPSRPGIFGVDLEADQPGIYEMTLRVDAPGLQDLHELGPVTVHPSGEPLAGGDDEEGEGISFLKEQQWVLEFGTVPVEVRSVRSSITVPGSVQPRAGGEALLTAPVPGRIESGPDVPSPGARVRAGAVIARIVPRSDNLRDAAALRSALVEAEQDHLLAVRERDRADRLVQARALPSRRLEEAESAVATSLARLEAARRRWGRFEASSRSGDGGSDDSVVAVRAPFDGVVAEVRFAVGASVEENQLLMRLVDAERVHIVGAIPESRAVSLTSVEAGELLIEGSPPIALSAPLSVGRIVEPSARTIQVRFAFDNRPARLRVGQSVGLRLFIGDAEERTAIPESAVVDDGGRPVVFVQSGGESFERRPVRLGSHAGGYVQVIDGVEPGERIVHRGAYLIRLAAMSTQIPAHGHVH